MDEALAALQFFTNSKNRVLVFEALSAGVTASSALAEHSGASRSTVARTLDAGESRGWIESEGSHYELTTAGRIMFGEVRRCLETIEGIQTVGEAINLLPEPARTLDYRAFRDAAIISGTPANPTEPFDHVAERIRSADRVRTLAWTGVPRLTKLIDEQALAGQLDCEAVMQADFFQTLEGRPDAASHWRAPAERGEVWAYEGTVPLSLHVVDETVVIWLGDPREAEVVVQGAFVCSDPAVRSWATSLYEEYRTDAERLDPAGIPQ